MPHIERDMGYDADIKKLGAMEHIPVADMANVEADRLDSIGKTKTKHLFPEDDTHTNPIGAELNAQAVVISLETIKSPLVSYLKEPVPIPAK